MRPPRVASSTASTGRAAARRRAARSIRPGRASRSAGRRPGAGLARPARRPAPGLLPGRSLRDDDGHHDVDEQRQAAGQDDQHGPHDPDERRVGVELLGHAAGDAGDHPVVAASDTAGHSSSVTRIRRRIEDERPGVGARVQLDLDCRGVVPGRAPGRAVLDQAMAGVVVAREDALAGMEAEGRALGGAQLDRAGVGLDRPVGRHARERQTQRAGVELDVDRPERRDRAEIDRRRSRRSSGGRSRPMVAPARSIVALPALSWTSRSRRGVCGSVTCHVT